MQSSTAEKSHLDDEDVVEQIQNGQFQLRDYLIKSHWNIILSIVVKMTGRPADFSDEFSVALQAFNEAIDCYDPTKNKSFTGFAGLVINRRVIDYMRKSGKRGVEYPFAAFQTEDDNDGGIEEKIAEPAVFTVKIEIQEEILNFKNTLHSFGITFDDLIRLSPKHQDTRLLCVSIAHRLAATPLASRLERERRLPIAEIAESFAINRKTVESHRKYIIALYLVLKSDMDIIKSYVNKLGKGAE